MRHDWYGPEQLDGDAVHAPGDALALPLRVRPAGERAAATRERSAGGGPAVDAAAPGGSPPRSRTRST